MRFNKPTKKALTCNLFAFILTILLFLLISCIGFAVGVFNDKSVVNKLSESDYYNKVYDTINSNSKDIVQKAGFPTSILDDVITLERVYIGGKNYVNDVLNGNEPDIKTDKLRTTLANNIDAYLNERGLIRTDKLKESSDVMIAAIEAEYEKGIQLKFVDYYTGYKADFIKLNLVMVPVLVLLIAVICSFLLRMNQYIHRGVRYITYALIASSSLTMLLAFYMITTKNYTSLTLNPDYYYDFITMYLKWDIMVFLYLGEIGLLLSLVLIPFTGYLKNRLYNIG